jgi:hypothetical protein
MIRRLTSLPTLVSVLVIFFVVGVVFSPRTNVWTFVGGVVLVLVAFGAAGMARYQRLSAWLRKSVPTAFENAPTAVATIVSVQSTGERYNDAPAMRYVVTVHAPEGDFASSLEALLPRRLAGRFTVGSSHPVRYLPDDHRTVVWDAEAAASRGSSAASTKSRASRRRKPPASDVAVMPSQEVSPVVALSESAAVSAATESASSEVPQVVTDPGQPLDAPSFISPAPLPDAAPDRVDQDWPPPSHSAEGAS